ncbi:MAG: hypothetical protein ACI4PO_06235 [Faecousia sp.]
MKDNEYYHSLEDWPQPPDEKPTLEVPDHTHRKSEPKPKKRRKLSKSLGGLFIGAVAVVMAVSIIDVKDNNDVTDEQDYFTDIGEYEPVGEGECLVCRQENCPYWVERYRNPGLTLTFDNDDAFSGTETYEQMLGKEPLTRTYTRSKCLYTPDGIRLFLSLEPSDMPFDIASYYVINGDTWIDSSGAFPVQGESAVSLRFQLEGISQKARGGVEEEEFGNLLLQLIYSPNDTVPEEGFRVMGEDWAYCATIPYSGADHIWIRAYSGISQNFCNMALEYCKVDVLYGDGLSYALGQTMWLTENDKVGRLWWRDDTIGGVCSNTLCEDQTYSLYADIKHRYYSIWSGYSEVYISVTHGATFTQLMERWMELNEDLPKNGHVEFFHLKELKSYTQNGITYRVFITWNDGPYNNGMTVILIPEQEQNISILFDLNNFSDLGNRYEISSLQDLFDNNENFTNDVSLLLGQITLRTS